MTSATFTGTNNGTQIAENRGHVSVNFHSHISRNEACLRDIRTTDPNDDKKRIEQAKGGLLEDSYRWILNNEEFKRWQNDQDGRLLWVKGDPGKGKTMLLCGIIDELTRSTAYTMSTGKAANIAFFFCQAADSRINTATAVIRGLIYSLVGKQRHLLSHVRNHYDQVGKKIFEDINAWHAVSRMFNDIMKDPSLQNTVTYLIIDALDECKTYLPYLLGLIIQDSPLFQNVRWIVSSRNWPEIEEYLETATQAAPISLELNERCVSEAVNIFIWHKVNQLAKVKKYDEALRDSVCQYLSLNSEGTFLWVALVCEELTKISRQHTPNKLKTFPPGLNTLYGRMIDQIGHLDKTDAGLCMRVLAIVSIAYRPLTLKELKVFLDEPFDQDEDLLEIIRLCGSFLMQRDENIRFIHQSAQDFLKISIEIFPRDIYDIKAPGLPVHQVKKPSPDPLAAAEYACIYWVDHLKDGICDIEAIACLGERGSVDVFLQQKYLHWIEALVIFGCLTQGISAILKLESLLQQRKCEPNVPLNRVRDASRFIRYHRPAIERSPLQVYNCLIFTPTRSLTRICYQMERPDWALTEPVVGEDWNSCLQILEDSSDGCREVSSVSWSHDGSQLASGSYDGVIRIWDPVTGHCISKSKENSDDGIIDEIAWLKDGSRLISVSVSDRVRVQVRTWNPATGQSVLNIKGKKRWNRLHFLSQDGRRFTSGSFDSDIRVWDVSTGQVIFFIRGKEEAPISMISLSPDGSQLGVGSKFDNNIRIWDIATKKRVSVLKGHITPVMSATWSQDGSRLIAWSAVPCLSSLTSYDRTIMIWDPITRKRILAVRGYFGLVISGSIAWSQDKSQFALGSDQASSTMVFDSATGECVSTLKGHNGHVPSIAWSPDGSRLASGSSDGTIRIWDPAISQRTSTLEGHRDQIQSIVWSQDRTKLASVAQHYDTTVRIWDPATGQCISTLEGHNRFVDSVTWSYDGSQIAAGCSDGTIGIWNPTTGQCISTLEGHSGKTIAAMIWSPDGSQIASSSYRDKTARIWNPATGQCESTLDISSSEFIEFDKVTVSSSTVETPDPITATSRCPAPLPQQYALNHDHSWVTDEGVSCLWLPPEYQPGRASFSTSGNARSNFSISGNNLALGCSSGRVIFLGFSQHHPIRGF